MKDIVVFGKPRAFESYSFEFGDNLAANEENAHIEPLLKPKKQHNAILHYFVKDGFACFEYYTHAKGFESDRDGSTFGIEIKTDKDLNLSDILTKVFEPFWEELASVLLDDDDKFVFPSIIDILKRTIWSNEELQLISSTIYNAPIQNTNKNLLLLVVPDFSKISTIEPKIKEYADVYIADNEDVFKDSINRLLLEKSNNQIFKIEEENIALIVEEPIIIPSKKKKAPSKNAPFQKINGQSTTPTNKRKSNWFTHNSRLIAFFGTGCLIIFGIIRGYMYYSHSIDKKNSDSKEKLVTPTSDTIKTEIKIAETFKSASQQVEKELQKRKDIEAQKKIAEKTANKKAAEERNKRKKVEVQQQFEIKNDLGTSNTDITCNVGKTIRFCANTDVTWGKANNENLTISPEGNNCASITSNTEEEYSFTVTKKSTLEVITIKIRFKK